MQFFKHLTHKHWTILAGANHEALSKRFPSMAAVFDIDAEIISSSIQNEIFSYQIADKTYFIKRFSQSIGFASWLGLSRFRIETRNQLWFNNKDLPSARVVAYGEERFLLKTISAILITEEIPDTTDLAYIATHQPDKFQNITWLRSLISQLAQILIFFHSHRFCHNDLHWRNILIKEDKPRNNVRAYLIDCPFGRRLFWPFLEYKKLKDLANIDKLAPQYLSRTQRLRFFLEYRNITRLKAEDKAMIRHILKHKANRIKRKAKEGK